VILRNADAREELKALRESLKLKRKDWSTIIHSFVVHTSVLRDNTCVVKLWNFHLL